MVPLQPRRDVNRGRYQGAAPMREDAAVAVAFERDLAERLPMLRVGAARAMHRSTLRALGRHSPAAATMLQGDDAVPDTELVD